MYPLIIVLSWIAARLTRIAHSGTMPKALISREEIATVISIGEEEGVVDEVSAQTLHRVVRLGERAVREVMTYRTEAIWLAQGATLTDFFGLYVNSPAQRYPVYEGDYDTVVGVLSIRDVLAALAEGGVQANEPITHLARPIYLVPESKALGELFGEMRDEGHVMAVIVSEYGGTSGILSIDQLVDEIVGEVREGLAPAKKAFEVVGARAYKIDGSMRIDEANEQLGLGVPEGDYNTISGFALHLFGHFPKVGEQLVHDKLRLVVAEVKENRITSLFLTKETRPKGQEDTGTEGSAS
jgi:putative hemolysin